MEKSTIVLKEIAFYSCHTNLAESSGESFEHNNSDKKNIPDSGLCNYSSLAKMCNCAKTVQAGDQSHGHLWIKQFGLHKDQHQDCEFRFCIKNLPWRKTRITVLQKMACWEGMKPKFWTETLHSIAALWSLNWGSVLRPTLIKSFDLLQADARRLGQKVKPGRLTIKNTHVMIILYLCLGLPTNNKHVYFLSNNKKTEKSNISNHL